MVERRRVRNSTSVPQQYLGKMLEHSVRHDGTRSFEILYNAVNKEHLARLRETFRETSCPRRLLVLVHISPSSSPLCERGAALRGKKSGEKPPAKRRTRREWIFAGHSAPLARCTGAMV